MRIQIDYNSHPAFAPFAPKRAETGGEYEHVWRKLDGVAEEVFFHSDLNSFASRRDAFEELAKPLRAEFQKILGNTPDVESRFVPRAKRAFRKMLNRTMLEHEQRRERLKPDFEVSAEAREKARFLDEHGHTTFKMPAKWFNPLCDLLKDELAAVRSRISHDTGNLLMCDSRAMHQAIVADWCASDGVFETLSALFGRKFDRLGFALHVSHPGDRWYHAFKDLGIPVADTVEMHYDNAYHIPKAMLYLNDVTLEQGPFSVMVGSHHWPDLGTWLNWSKELGVEINDFRAEVGQNQQGHNQSPFMVTEVRQAFASLPKGLQTIPKPGDFIPDGSDLSKALLAAETRLTGEAGTLGIFTGSHCLHRGGICQKGERWALQITFEPKEKLKLPESAEKRNSASAMPAAKENKKGFFSFFRTRSAPVFSPVSEGASHEAKKTTVPTGKAVDEKPAPRPRDPSAGRYDEPAFRNALAALVGAENRITAVDVGGAADIVPHWHRIHKVTDYVVYEPHPASIEGLVKRQQGNKYYASMRYVPEALAGANGERTLYQTHVPTGTTMLKLRPGSIADFPGNSYVFPLTEEKVRTHTLESSLSRLGVNAVHAIKLDTQGTELEILRGLGPERLRGLLVIEMEVAVLQHYEDTSTTLDHALAFAREIGMEVFDFRTNRFPGNAIRLPAGTVEGILEVPIADASVAHRLNEVDVIFFKDPRILIDQGTDEATLRRLVGLLCAYYMFPEAIYTALHARDCGIFSPEMAQAALAGVKQMHGQARLQTAGWQQNIAAAKGQNWGQYLWVPYPSA